MLDRLTMKISASKLLYTCFYLLTSSGTITHGHEAGPGVIRVVVAEGRDAILPCSLSTGENIEQTLFDWKKDDQKEVFLYQAGDQYNNGRAGQDEHFKGRVFHFQEELKRGNASIIIKNTKILDSGSYTCDFPLFQPNGQKSYIELVVGAIDRDRSGKIRGAAREPYIKILNATEDGVLLQCEVRDASPKPEIEWQDCAGNNLTAEELQVTDKGDRYDVTLLTTVTKTDRFRCVVKQKEINHEVSAETYVPVPEKRCEDWAGWVFGVLFFGALILAAVLALLVATDYITITLNKGSPRQMNCSCNGSSHVPLKPEPQQNGDGESNGFV